MKFSFGSPRPAFLAWLLESMVGNHRRSGIRGLVLGSFVLFLMSGSSMAGLPAPRPDPALPPVQVNRTIPQVAPPNTVLRFSSSPTVDEFFRARIFAEPLVPIGGNPS